jgi:galactose mutarotase-like enzyme
MDYKIDNGFLSVTISSIGGELLQVTGKEGTEYIWPGDPALWKRHAPHLFPIVGRLTRGQCTIEGDPCHMNPHGFLRDREMTPVLQTADTLSFTTLWDDETLAHFPRRWKVQLTYTLNENALSICFHLENLDEKNIWFAYGGHPGFCLPLEPGLSFEDYRLRFDEECAPMCVGLTEACFIGGPDQPLSLVDGELPLRHSLFDGDTLILRDMSSTATLYAPKGRRKIIVSYPQMPYLALWHPAGTTAPFVCIEPWTGLPARQDIIEELAEKPGSLCLKPGRSYENTWQITFQ